MKIVLSKNEIVDAGKTLTRLPGIKFVDEYVVDKFVEEMRQKIKNTWDPAHVELSSAGDEISFWLSPELTKSLVRLYGSACISLFGVVEALQMQSEELVERFGVKQ